MSDCCPTHEGCYDDCPVCRLELAEETIQRLEKENAGLREFIRVEMSNRCMPEPEEWCNCDTTDNVTCRKCGKHLLNE
jgi:hypothetical protein